MYPFVKDDVEIGVGTYDGEKISYIKNQNGYIYEVDGIIAEELSKADGSHPISLDEEEVNWLIENNFLNTSRFVRGKVVNRFVLTFLSEKINKSKQICSLMNRLLPFMSIIIFGVGFYIRRTNPMVVSTYLTTNYWIYISLILFSLIFHELAHMCAAISYEFKISEFSIVLLGLIPVGACVVCRQNEHASTKKKLQFILAGIEANLLLSGLFHLLSVYLAKNSTEFLDVANFNIFIAIFNLLPCFLRLDGEKSLSIFLGVESIEQTARQWLFKKDKRYKLFHSGYIGFTTMLIYILCIIADIVFVGAISLDCILILLFLIK